MYHSWFNHSPTVGHLFFSSFYHDKDAMNIELQVFAWIEVLISLGLNGNITDGCIVTGCSGFTEIKLPNKLPNYFPEWLHQFK